MGISGNYVVVGAPNEVSSGDVYVFNTLGGTVKELVSPNPTTSGQFGTSVSVSGATVLVGAQDEFSSGLPDAGNAYTFSATSGALILGSFTSPNAQTDGFFGYSVAISGGMLVVGAPGETAAGITNAGHAYVFADLPLALSTPNPFNFGAFGYSVATSGAITVVGAPSETVSGHAQAGHAYIFNTVSGTVLTLTSPNEQASGNFGGAVAISGSTVVVGAWGETASAVLTAGNVYTFRATTGSLMRTFTSPNPVIDGRFGWAVAISGNTVVVGAERETAASISEAGHVYTFSESTGQSPQNVC